MRANYKWGDSRMKYVKFTDWQELGLKKDVEKISKELQSQDMSRLAVCWDVVCSTGSLIVGFLMDNSEAKIISLSILIVAAFIPVIILGIAKAKEFVNIICSVFKGDLDTSKIVDNFDNKVCCWTMMSTSYADTLISSHKEITEDEILFLYQEINYYINKSIEEIDTSYPIIGKVFSNEPNLVAKNKLISSTRLYNILKILERTRPCLDISIDNIDTSTTCNIRLANANSDDFINIKINLTRQYKEIFKFQEKINKEYMNRLNTFLKNMKNNFPNDFLFGDFHD